MTLPEELEKYVKSVASENSVVIIQGPEDEIDSINNALYMLNRAIFHMKIIFVACPDTFKVTIVPKDSVVKMS